MASEKKSEKSQVRSRLKRTAPGAKPNKAVVTGMHNELRAQILILLNERVASRPELCKELGASFDSVRYEMEVLKKTKPPLIELVHEKPVRGTVEKFYRATMQAYLDPSEWPGVPDAVKVGMRGSLLGLLVDDAVAAVKDGTFDSLANAHMSWMPMIVDEQGWEELTAILLHTMKEALKIKKDSAERLIGKDQEGISCTVSMLGYPSANEKRKVGPPAPARRSKAKRKTKAALGKAGAMRKESTGEASSGAKRKAPPKSKRKGAGR